MLKRLLNLFKEHCLVTDIVSENRIEAIRDCKLIFLNIIAIFVRNKVEN